MVYFFRDVSTCFMNLILPILRVFQLVETVLVTQKVLIEASLSILTTRPQLLICTTVFDTKKIENKETIVLAATVPLTMNTPTAGWTEIIRSSTVTVPIGSGASTV